MFSVDCKKCSVPLQKDLLDEANSSRYTIYSTKQFLSAVHKSRAIDRIRHLRLFEKYRLYSIRQDDTVLVSAALVEERDGNLHFLGSRTNACYHDFTLYDGADDADVVQLLLSIAGDNKGKTLSLEDLSETSVLANELLSRGFIAKEHPSFAIHLPSSYEDYFSGLSKSTRQNIRTAFNRVDRSEDIEKVSLKHYRRSQISESLIRRLDAVYLKRRAEWKDAKTISLGKISQLLRPVQDPIYRASRMLECSKISVLYFDDSIAAFMVAFDYPGGTIVPRLAIDSDFSFYSPGIAMLILYIRELYEEGRGDSFVLDLCRGEELYKKKLGGTESKIYSFDIATDDIASRFSDGCTFQKSDMK